VACDAIHHVFNERAVKKYSGINTKSEDLTPYAVLIVTIATENGCELLHADRHFDLMTEQGMGLSLSKMISSLKYGMLLYPF
jgi:hypothetical protein